MKNVTASIVDRVYRVARAMAVFSRLEAQQAQILDEVESFSASERLARDEIHNRAVR